MAAKRKNPQIDTQRTRNSQVKIRLTEDEVMRLKAAAAAQDMSLADFVMSGVDRERRIVLPGGGQIRTELLREGRNLNQALLLCRMAAKEGRSPDTESLTAAAAKVKDVLDQLVELIQTWRIDISKKLEPEVSKDADRQVRSE